MKRIVFMMSSLLCFGIHAERIEVFTTSSHPVALNGFLAQVCELDALKKITNALNQKAIWSEPDEATSVRVTAFYRCQSKARRYALTSLPAIVIDNTFVVYGMRAVDKALMATRQYKEVHHA